MSQRQILYARPFPSHGHVGVHYWFEDASGAIFSEEQAASTPGPFTLHVRNNVGAGFLTMWSTADGGVELTPRYGNWSGHRMAEQVFVLPGVVPATGERSSRFVIVFARR